MELSRSRQSRMVTTLSVYGGLSTTGMSSRCDSARMDILEKGLQLEKGASGGRLEVVVSSASSQVEGSVNEGSEAMIRAHVRITPDPETPYNRFRSRSAKTDQAATSPSLALPRASIVCLQVIRHHPEAVPSSRTHNSSRFPNMPTRLYNS